MATATSLAHAARLGLWAAPWAVRQHPQPHGRQHPWLWSCDTSNCTAGGVGVSEADAHQQGAEHHLAQHN